MNAVKFYTIIIFFLMISGSVHAAILLPDILSDSMVLQRNKPVPIWGDALPGEAISLSFNGQQKNTLADDEGKWIIYLDPMEANATPQAMVITGINTIRIKGVLIGEVWLCSGQSNMQLTLDQTNKGDSVTASADYPLIRLFNIDRKVAFGQKYGPLAHWKACTPSSVRAFSAAAYYFGVELQKKLNVPVAVINSSFGGSQAEAWTPVSYLHTPDLQPCIDREKDWQAARADVQREYAVALDKWRQYAAEEKKAGRKPKEAPHQPEALRDYRIAGSIYEGMIAPLMPFAIKGIIWYQGESNEDRAEQYGILLPVMIRAWRAGWGEKNLPFGIVQLPNYRNPEAQPVDQAWSHIREAQRQTADSVPATGLIVTIDIGEAHNIHPYNKYDVGYRMSVWAMSEVYHLPVLSGGPVFVGSGLRGGRMVLTFSNVGQGIRTRDGKALTEFAVAGTDRRWYWAQAKIVGRDKIEVWSKDVKTPVAVRYAFNNNPENPNLTNDSGIPASPFRSDNWSGPTHGKR